MSKNLNPSRPRLFFIDNLRIFLTCLVVLHHWAIANGAPGDWYFKEGNLTEIGTLLMSMFVATNQAFFMGFFFFISAYFLPGSIDKKGRKVFVTERIKRLGIPLFTYIFIISPFVIFLVQKHARAYNGNFWQFLIDGEGIFSNGPLWFVALLLIFSLFYLLVHDKVKKLKFNIYKQGVSFYIPMFLILVTVTFFIRVYLPIGDWIPVLGIQPAHLTQYVICFALGILAYKTKAFEFLAFKKSIRWFGIAQVLILVVFPAIFILSGDSGNVELFMGGFTYQSLLFALWEQSVAVSLILGLLGISERYFNNQNALLQDLSANSYAIYILHSIALVTISLLLQSSAFASMSKFIIIAFPAILFSYFLAKLVRLVPAIRRIV